MKENETNIQHTKRITHIFTHKQNTMHTSHAQEKKNRNQQHIQKKIHFIIIATQTKQKSNYYTQTKPAYRYNEY